ncbi:MAG: hypothetical protein PVJ84_02660 [Desulfobacteraceae bacterium]|jgi:hypothetical protein
MKSKLVKCSAVLSVIGLMVVSGAIAAAVSITGITGTVEKTDGGIMICADPMAAYNVMGADHTDIIGNTVKATDTLVEGPSGKVFTVISVEPVQK